MVDEKPNQSLELTESPEAPVETYQVLYDANADDAGGTVTDPKYYITGRRGHGAQKHVHPAGV